MIGEVESGKLDAQFRWAKTEAARWHVLSSVNLDYVRIYGVHVT